MMKKLSFLCLLSLIAGSVQAEISWYVDGSLALGGDTMAEVEVETFGGDIEDSKIKAGEGLSLSIGGRFDITGNLDGVLSYGYKFGGVVASDGSATFDRKPITAMLYYDFGKVQLGLGKTRETGAKLDLADAGGPNLRVEDADGNVLALLWSATSDTSIGLRYTLIDYDLTGFSNSYNGDHFAVFAAFSF